MHIIGHRGASRDRPENTLSAFEEAFHQGADAIEFDTYQHDDTILVFHDRYLHRTTNGQGRFKDSSLADLRHLDAGHGQTIPLLSEALLCIPADAWCNIEIKSLRDTQQWLEQLDKAITSARVSADRLLISSFNHHWLTDIKHHRPYLTIGALTASYTRNSIVDATAISASTLHVALDVITPEYVRDAHNAGLKVYVYTVDGHLDMLELESWGVDGIFTNVPAFARHVLHDEPHPALYHG
ncbi:glycerophosphodiester phosphodiesterase [Alteromonas halophila]|uniref:Glycerophosphoryl diester phosphodiesterase n=1 Tax=Alteromonas halophila TaxID=516698 RepID=A0A918JG14_9ALTE|nr:glycerophosphodiester phosphodiesterase family protein [Alteromonas halophila]GGW79139.1 glycerophosphoryl diester phosphodiesterase [Alteromonas halophila]